MNTNTFDDEFLTPAQCAAEAKCSRQTIRDAYRSGELKAFQPHKKGHVKVTRSALYTWLGRSAARNVETLEDGDWSTPADGADPSQDFDVQDEWTLFIRVHASRLSEFMSAKSDQGR